MYGTYIGKCREFSPKFPLMSFVLGSKVKIPLLRKLPYLATNDQTFVYTIYRERETLKYAENLKICSFANEEFIDIIMSQRKLVFISALSLLA